MSHWYIVYSLFFKGKSLSNMEDDSWVDVKVFEFIKLESVYLVEEWFHARDLKSWLKFNVPYFFAFLFENFWNFWKLIGFLNYIDGIFGYQENMTWKILFTVIIIMNNYVMMFLISLTITYVMWCHVLHLDHCFNLLLSIHDVFFTTSNHLLHCCIKQIKLTVVKVLWCDGIKIMTFIFYLQGINLKVIHWYIHCK